MRTKVHSRIERNITKKLSRSRARWDTNMAAVSLRSDFSPHVCAPYLKVIRCKGSQTLDVEKAKEKSQLKQLVLTTLFGPLGLFYSNKVIAVLLSMFFIPSTLAFGFGILVGWPFSMLVGVICVKQYNIKVQPYLTLQKRKALYKQGRINGSV